MVSGHPRRGSSTFESCPYSDYIFPCSQSGLTQACIDSPHSKDFVRQEVLNYIKKWIPKDRIGVLAGNSVHMDRVFLVEEMPEVVEWLHYRIVGESLRIF